VTRRRRRQRVGRELGTTEIELLPMLNVFIAIIPLLLLSAAFVQLAIIPTSAPAVAAAGGGQRGVVPLGLSVIVSDGAYVVTANGVQARSVARPPADGAARGLAEGPRHQLLAVLESIAAGHPGAHEVRIVAQATTRYEEIIDLMDVTRAAGFPDAALDGPGQGGA